MDGHDTSGAEPSPGKVEARDLIVSLHVNRAAALLLLERREDAEQACDAALVLQPENVKALYRRGVARAENPIKAIEDLKRALKLEPGNTAAKRELAKAERRRAEREREEQRKMKQGLRKAASLSLYGDKEAEKREKAQRKKRREAAQRERHQACNAARRAEGKEELSICEWEKDEKATREKLAKDRERASEAAAAARRDERRRRSGGGDDVVVVDDEGDLARGYKTTDDGRRTSYFRRTPDADTAQLLAANQAPQRITAAAEVTDSDGSAWNAAGTTFEERDMKTWCERRCAGGCGRPRPRLLVYQYARHPSQNVVERRRSSSREAARGASSSSRRISNGRPSSRPMAPRPGACTITGELRMPEISSSCAMTAPTPRARAQGRAILSPAPSRARSAALVAREQAHHFAAAARRAPVVAKNSSATTPSRSRRFTDDDAVVHRLAASSHARLFTGGGNSKARDSACAALPRFVPARPPARAPFAA